VLRHSFDGFDVSFFEFAMPTAPSILALLVAIAGWFYLFNSKAAKRLDGIEGQAANNRRDRLRRLNGLAMLPLALGFYAGFKINPKVHPIIFLCLWTIVMILVVFVVVLAIIDLRLTSRLRRKS
jgi:hypothetical protein